MTWITLYIYGLLPSLKRHEGSCVDMLQKITLVPYIDDITPVRLDDQEGASVVGDKAYKNSEACWNFPFNVKDSFLP